jgi:hypothetical protein
MPCGNSSPHFKTKKLICPHDFQMRPEYPRDIEILFFYLRFTEALAKQVGAGNPDSAIHPQFMRHLIIRGQIGYSPKLRLLA